uniref:tRNA (cytosine(38)-C(5))-methyltransferase n=1 Tax=Pristionchus pacificus TaxID=54126 RepID=Q5MK09_PRIPA|nr:5' cytosine DNA methyl transferase-like protein [Pristionchus pacificus]
MHPMHEGEEVKVLEFYCGIGGIHFALKRTSIPFHIAAAFDINTTTNVIYRHNFPSTKLKESNIQGVSVSSLDKLGAELWTMSPPCQPFTLKGNRKGDDDPRCDSFKKLLHCLNKMSNRPRWIFIENVSAFHSTSMHSTLIETLNTIGYRIEEYMLSPVQLGIPNSRPRYYLLASLMEGPVHNEYVSHLYQYIDGVEECEMSTVREYLSDNVDTAYLSSDKVDANNLSIVEPSSISSSCFTKSYTQFLVGCGSYLRTCSGIRPFSPREVASLMSFPNSFSWPHQITQKQVYRALGNSVNVLVVSKLLERLLTLK